MKYLKLALDFLMGISYLILQIGLGVLLIYFLGLAFLPYQPLETNAAGLCGFFALMGYWYWKFSNLDSEVRFWQIF